MFGSLFGKRGSRGRQQGFQEAFIDGGEGTGHQKNQQHSQSSKQRQPPGGYTPPPHEPPSRPLQNPQHRHQHQHQPQQQRPSASPQPARLTPDAAATRIQAAWRGARVGRHRGAVKKLASAERQLAGVSARAHELLREQAGQPLAQKQFLELSESVMRVLFELDAVSCGPVPELRAKRKQLTSAANALLDDLQGAHKSAAGAAAALAKAAGAKAGAAGAHHVVQPAAGPQPHGVRKAGKGR